MKYIISIALLTSLLSLSAFAAETETDCPWADQSERVVTKSNDSQVKKPVETKGSSTTKQ